MLPEPENGRKALEGLWVNTEVHAVVADDHGLFDVICEDLDVEQQHLLLLV